MKKKKKRKVTSRAVKWILLEDYNRQGMKIDYEKVLAKIKAIRTEIKELSESIGEPYGALRCDEIFIQLEELERRVKGEQIMAKHNRNPYAS